MFGDNVLPNIRLAIFRLLAFGRLYQLRLVDMPFLTSVVSMGSLSPKLMSILPNFLSVDFARFEWPISAVAGRGLQDFIIVLCSGKGVLTWDIARVSIIWLSIMVGRATEISLCALGLGSPERAQFGKFDPP